MKTFTVKQGMKFKCSNKQLSEMPYMKDYTYLVLKKHGRFFKVRFFNGIGCGEDYFEKWELEKMTLLNPEIFK